MSKSSSAQWALFSQVPANKSVNTTPQSTLALQDRAHASRLKIAILGARGIPGRYGGFETFATELAPRLAAKGHQVTVYCQPRYSLPERPAEYLGVRLHYTPVPRSRYFETPIHEFFSLLHALFQSNDVLYVLAFRSSILYVLPRLFGKKIVMNTDGLDWKRSKWNRLGRAYLRCSEAIGARFASTALIADAVGMQEYIWQNYRKPATFIPYGAPLVSSTQPELIYRYGLAPRSYFLVVARIEPENNTHVIVSAFERVATDKKLVIVGGTNYRSRYLAALKGSRDPRITFLGAIYDQSVLNELLCNAYAYIHGHEVGGTNPALLQAMGCGCCSLVRDINFNRDVIADAGIAWQPAPEDLAGKIGYLLDNPDVVSELRARAQKRVRMEYNWESVADRHEACFYDVCGVPRPLV